MDKYPKIQSIFKRDEKTFKFNVRGRSLGNAIVPQVAIAIMKGIKEFD